MRAPNHAGAVEMDAALDPAALASSAATVARELLGMLLVADDGTHRTGGIIVETEAYLGRHDPASHIARGRTPRTEPFFRGAGTVYVYAIHRHVCLNVVTWHRGEPECVLIRALEPTVGVERMHARRDGRALHELASGPGKLCRALGITLTDSGRRLGDGRIAILRTDGQLGAIGVSARIGISKAVGWPLRFFAEGNPHVSRTPRRVAIDPTWTLEAFHTATSHRDSSVDKDA